MDAVVGAARWRWVQRPLPGSNQRAWNRHSCIRLNVRIRARVGKPPSQVCGFPSDILFFHFLLSAFQNAEFGPNWDPSSPRNNSSPSKVDHLTHNLFQILPQWSVLPLCWLGFAHTGGQRKPGKSFGGRDFRGSGPPPPRRSNGAGGGSDGFSPSPAPRSRCAPSPSGPGRAPTPDSSVRRNA